MLIGGLWHGAAWTFVVWGGLHGVFLCVERLIRQNIAPARWHANPIVQFGYGLLTFCCVALAWIWFRAADFSSAWQIQSKLFALSSVRADLGTVSGEQTMAIVTLPVLIVVHWLFRERDPKQLFMRMHPLPLGLLLAFMLTMVVLSPGENHAFIYFQF